MSISGQATMDGEPRLVIPPEDLKNYYCRCPYDWILTLEEAVLEAEKFLAAAALDTSYQVRLPPLSEGGERPVLCVPAERAKRLGLLLLRTVCAIEQGRHLN